MGFHTDFLKPDEFGLRDVPSIVTTTVGIHYIVVNNIRPVGWQIECVRISMHAKIP